MRGFSPDLPRVTQDIITDCENFIPYESGMEAAPSAASQGIDALAAACVGAAAISKLDGTNRVFAASATRVYELSGTSWTDRSAGGSAYTTTTNWQFTQFGDATIAAGYGNALQYSTSGAFAAISGAPQAKVLFSVITGAGGFVIAANTNTSTDQWACCGLDDYTTWTPAVATQANTGRLLGNDSGAITAGLELGDSPVLFKRRTMFVGRYVGGDATFAFSEVPGGAGCVGPDARCSIDVGVFFVGPDNFWIFDGARPLPIGDQQIRQWFFANSSATYRSKTICVFDKFRNRVRIFYPSNASTGTIDAQIVYHLATKEWGRDNMTVEYAFTFVPTAITMDNVAGTMDNAPSDMDSDYWNPSERSVGIFDSAHTLKTLTGAAAASSYVTHDFGDEVRESFINDVRLRYQAVPQTASVNAYSLDEAGDTATLTDTFYADSSDGAMNKFDVRQSSKFHRLQFQFTGTCRVIGMRPTLIHSGGR